VPLARPLFIYPSGAALERPEFDAFMEYYLENINNVAEQVGFIGLTEEQLSDNQAKLTKLIEEATGGSGESSGS
jgi:phosphate transport system substrate-binding protein